MFVKNTSIISRTRVNSAPGKRAKLENLINYADPDLIIMTETKIDEQVKASEFLPKGYTGDNNNIYIIYI